MTSKQLLALPMPYTAERPAVVSDPSLLVLAPDIRRVFLFPQSAKRKQRVSVGDVKSRRWGWVDCIVGGLEERDGVRVLTQSSISAEDFDVESVHPVRFVRSLKRHVAKSTRCGVRAVGSEFVYKSYRYTEAATQLAREGVVWKQLAGSTSAFEPAPAIFTANES